MQPHDNTKAVLRLHTQLARVMADGRFSDGRRKGAELRAFIIAYHWARFEGGDQDDQWERTRELAGLTGNRDDGWKLRQLYGADAPRFEPVGQEPWHRPTCPVPMLAGPRTGEPCGKTGTLTFRRTDPVTGEWVNVGYCTRHKDIGDREYHRQRQQQAACPAPTPVPNTGGLLPCYIRATNWPDIYTDACCGWKPPPVGLAADDWPVLVKVHEKAQQARRWFTVVPGGQQTTNDDRPPPALRLVGD